MLLSNRLDKLSKCLPILGMYLADTESRSGSESGGAEQLTGGRNWFSSLTQVANTVKTWGGRRWVWNILDGAINQRRLARYFQNELYCLKSKFKSKQES